GIYHRQPNDAYPEDQQTQRRISIMHGSATHRNDGPAQTMTRRVGQIAAIPSENLIQQTKTVVWLCGRPYFPFEAPVRRKWSVRREPRRATPEIVSAAAPPIPPRWVFL
ncbi:MAG: hypothetical protein WBD06_04515, partial [Acidobacteriaceae bacterium]